MTTAGPAIGSPSPEAAATLTSAFFDDPFFTWLFPPSPGRRPGMARFWTLVLADPAPGNELWVMPDEVSVAYWMPPRESDAAEPDPDRQAAFGALITELAGDHAPACFEMFGRIGAAHPTEPHWYLAAVGTRPEHQGSGLGGAVLAPVLAHCDAEGLPAYLESSNPRNVAFYHRLGFEETGRIETPDGATHMTAMWRSPKGSASAGGRRP